jgi:alkylation response protein AidB-like acyl-CoA dehydrogenase
VHSEEQLALRDTLRRLLTKESDPAAVRAATSTRSGFDRALWTRLCTDIGIAGLGIPERHGGLGAGLPELHIALAELGRALTPCPMLGSAVLAAQAILATGNDDAAHRLLPGIAAGTTIAALVSPMSPVDGTLTGTAHHVLDAAVADVLIVATTTEAFEVDPAQPGVTIQRVPTMDPTRPLDTVRLDHATGRHLGPADLARLRDVACVALAAEQVGAARRCLELTVEYTRNRHQFGRPIASFQALKHRMADMFVLVETAESAALAATTAEDLPLAAAVAKTHCSEAFQAVAAEMIQLHGGIAITWEHDAHLYFKRAHGSAHLFGHPREHLARLGPR